MKELILPFPPRILNPNNRRHWSEKAKAVKIYRQTCFYLAKAAGWVGVEFASQRMHLWIDFYPPDKRNYDDESIRLAHAEGVMRTQIYFFAVGLLEF
jgi:crossover junction endodeoxyribonuclease RusA